MAGILAWFWNERFWLPHNVTWADLKNTDEATFPQAEDLYLACPLAFCIFMIRLVFERWVRAHAINSGVCDAVCYVGELNDASTARLPRSSASCPNNGICLARRSPRLIIPLSAGLQHCALPAFDASVGAHTVHPSCHTSPKLVLSSQSTYIRPLFLTRHKTSIH